MSEQELARRAKHRLAIIHHAEEVTGNVAMTCRYFGISRHTYRPGLSQHLTATHRLRMGRRSDKSSG